MLKRIAIALALLIATPFVPAASLSSNIDQHAAPFVDSKRLVSLSVGVIKDGKTTVRNYGSLSLKDKTKPDIDTFYEIGSVTKVFTTTLLSDMVKRGKVTLDQPVEQLLDDRFEIPQFKKRKITLRDLATHQSALPRMPHNFAPKDPKNPYATYSELRLIVGLAETKLKRSPGEKYAYSNLGMGLLGHALSKKAGKPYEQLIIDRIVKPLGMKDTKITFAKADRPRIATGYDAAHNEWPNWDLNSLSAAGAIRSTVRDMLRFVDANLKLDTKAPINDAMKLTQTRQAGTGMGSIALGWHIARDGTTYWHNGQTGGYHSYIAFNRKFNIGVVVFATGNVNMIDAMGEKLVVMLAGGKPTPVGFQKAVQVNAKDLERYVGKYQLQPGFIFTITRKDNHLFAQLTGQPAIEIYPSGEHKFFYKVVKAKITFVVDNNGKVTTLILHQHGRDMPSKRIETQKK